MSVTDDPDEACEWLDAFSYSSAEGLVVKGAATWYQPGRRGWAKVKHRDNEVIVGAVIGSIDRPEVVVGGGLPRKRPGDSRPYRPAEPAQAAELAAVLKPAGAQHPWPDEVGADHWGHRAQKVRSSRSDRLLWPRWRLTPPTKATVTAILCGSIVYGRTYIRASVDALIPLTGVPLGQRRARGRRGAVSSPLRRSLFGA